MNTYMLLYLEQISMTCYIYKVNLKPYLQNINIRLTTMHGNLCKLYLGFLCFECGHFTSKLFSFQIFSPLLIK